MSVMYRPERKAKVCVYPGASSVAECLALYNCMCEGVVLIFVSFFVPFARGLEFCMKS